LKLVYNSHILKKKFVCLLWEKTQICFKFSVKLTARIFNNNCSIKRAKISFLVNNFHIKPNTLKLWCNHPKTSYIIWSYINKRFIDTYKKYCSINECFVYWINISTYNLQWIAATVELCSVCETFFIQGWVYYKNSISNNF
jgi:hypothetical protein